jgi:16S rRNA (guanine527-N7)-methyltransferase
MEKLIAGATKLGLQLGSGQLKQFSVYYHELIDWNRRLNLTRITGYEEIQVKHFLDSLTVTLAFKPPLDNSLGVIDIGTGAGLPGIPLKIMLPGIKLVLLEATAKKAAFLEHIKRAVATLPSLVELTLPFCVVGGSFIAQNKGAIYPELGQATRAIKTLGGNLREVKRVDLEEFTDERHLIIIDKVSPTPGIYPRRPGIPVKRPLT